MKLFQVTTVPSTLWFLESHVLYMTSRGWEVHAAANPGQELDQFAALLNVRTHAIPMTRNVSPLHDLRALFNLIGLFLRERPDIVHAHTPKAGVLAMTAAFVSGVRCRFFHIHGLPHSTARGITRLLLRWTTRLSCQLASRVLCVSGSAAHLAVDEGLCRPDRIKVPGNGTISGIDTARFDPDRCAPAGLALRRDLGIATADLAIGFLGRLVRDKGVGDLAEAWIQIRREFTNAHLVIAGDLEERDALPEGVIESLRADARVHLLGWFSDTPALYAAVDLIALPTYREGFGMVLLEAASMRLPVVATRVTGCVDAVVDGSTGLLVEAGDVGALAAALIRYLEDKQLRGLHGRLARERAQDLFQPEEAVIALSSEYEDALGRRRVGLPYTLLRRAVDAILAALLLLAFAPVLAITALAVRLRLGSPVLFRQPRLGLNERPFTILKFRTMRVESGMDGKPLPDSARLTGLGRWLRRTSLDELPELWNVLRGDMSLIGPRPLLLDYLDYFTERERLRFTIRPGITGWAQIHGRNRSAWDQRLERDAWYVENRSLGLDARILIATAAQVFLSKDVVDDPRSIMLNLNEERQHQAR